MRLGAPGFSDVLTIPFLGDRRASWQYPFGDLLRAGATLAGGSDWPVSSADPLDGIHILYVGDGYVARAAPMIEQAAARSILVVTESDGALAHGSVINFRVLDERVRFEISLDSAGKAGLRVSSQLLVLASSIVKDKR